VGLVIAAKNPKKDCFDRVIGFHFGGLGGSTHRITGKWSSWGKVLETAPAKISSVLTSWKESSGEQDLYVIAGAGPQHPGNKDDFLADYKIIVKNIPASRLKRQILFWTMSKGDLAPSTDYKSEAIAGLSSDGTGFAIHKETPEKKSTENK
jgi:hypothetical protein